MAHQRPGRSNQGAKADWRGYLLMTTAFIFCPCHLPLILAVVGTTGLLGSWLSQNLTWIGLANGGLLRRCAVCRYTAPATVYVGVRTRGGASNVGIPG